MEEGKEGKGVGGGRGLGGTGWWSICALRTEYSTLYCGSRQRKGNLQAQVRVSVVKARQ